MARNEDEVVDWLDCVSAIETDQGVVYFCDQEYFAQRESKEVNATSQDKLLRNFEEQAVNLTESSNTSDICELEKKVALQPIGEFVSRFPSGYFLYSLTGYNPMNMEQDIIENLTCNDRLLGELKEHFPDCKILNNFSYFPSRPHHFEKGFTVMVPVDYPGNHLDIIHGLAVKYCQAAYFKCVIWQDSNDQTLVLLENGPMEVKERLIEVERLSYHPAYLHHRNNSVFHNSADAINILSKCHHIPEAKSVLQIVSEYTARPRFATSAAASCPVIAVEGLDNIGIAQVSRILSKSITAKHLESPPKCLQPLKQIFDNQNQLIKGAFYTLGNYILAAQIQREIQRHPVVLDRYWNSTAAFTISKEVGCGASNLPPKGHFVYEWPNDLPKPTTTVLLTSKRDVRSQQRGDKAKINLRQLTHQTFRRMKNNSWIEVDKTKQKLNTKDALAAAVLNKLHDNKIISFHSGNENDSGICPGTKIQEVVAHDRFVDDPESMNASQGKKHCVMSNLPEWGNDIPALIIH